MVDDLDGDATGAGLGERAGDGAVQRRPGVGVDLGLEGGPQRLVGVVRTEEVGVAAKKLSSL